MKISSNQSWSWWTALLAVMAGMTGCASMPPPEAWNVIPRPFRASHLPGSFALQEGMAISAPPELQNEARYLRRRLRAATGFDLKLVAASESAAISLQLDEAVREAEGYRVRVTESGIQLAGRRPAGVFYAIQTLRQMWPPEIESPTPVAGIRWRVPAGEVEDAPQFAWRGFMLDESRHFFGKEHVRQLLEEMALRKLNTFHWHLTDTPGWRLDIPSFPKLTGIGAIGNHSDPRAPARFYTQADIREIVAFAAERHIQIIPEIDMPGHAAAANRAYPEHSGGGSAQYPDFTFHPASPRTRDYLAAILRDTARQFPAPYLHFGGDEVHFGNEAWDALPEVVEMMKREGLPDRRAVEHQFNRDMARVIAGLGKTTVGWDEIVDAGVPPETCVVMWWRHNKPEVLQNALRKNYRVVLCPRIPCYFDFVQSPAHQAGRRWDGQFCPLDRVYAGPAVPAGHETQILGLQACLWSEVIATPDRAHFMTFPRLDAFAEAAWLGGSPRKDYEDFLRRLPSMLRRLDLHGIPYFNPFQPESTPEIGVHGTRDNPASPSQTTPPIHD